MERLVKRVGTGNAVPTKFDMDFVFGLDIETFHGIQKIFNQLCNLTDILGDNCDLDRLRELVEADRDGRCYIPSVKIGDMIFVHGKEGGIISTRIQGISLPVHGNKLILHLGGYPAEYLWSDREGIDWWRSREAAKTALKGEAYGG